jgi:hypothetical protein
VRLPRDYYPELSGGLLGPVSVIRDYHGETLAGLSLAECTHDGATEDPRFRDWRLRHAPLCGFCKADARMTDGFTRRVKRLVITPKELTLL